MITEDRYKKTFEQNWGDWDEFQALVKQEVKPKAIQARYKRRNGEPMSKQTFHRWSRRVL